MGRILDARGDEALDVLSDLLEPIREIAADPEISAMMRTSGNGGNGGNGGKVLDLARATLKNHKEAVIRVMAIDDGKTVDEEKTLITALTIPGRLVRLMTVPAVRELLFGLAETGRLATGSAVESGSGNG